MFFPNNFEN